MNLWFPYHEVFPGRFFYVELHIFREFDQATSMANGLLTVKMSIDIQPSLQYSRYMSVTSRIQLNI